MKKIILSIFSLFIGNDLFADSQLSIQDSVARMPNSCTAILISDRVALTPSHCFHHGGYFKNDNGEMVFIKGSIDLSGSSGSMYFEQNGSSFYGFKKNSQISGVFVPEVLSRKIKYDEGTPNSGTHFLISLQNSLAVVILREPAPKEIRRFEISDNIGSTSQLLRLGVEDYELKTSTCKIISIDDYKIECDADVNYKSGFLFDEEEKLVGVQMPYRFIDDPKSNVASFFTPENLRLVNKVATRESIQSFDSPDFVTYLGKALGDHRLSKVFWNSDGQVNLCPVRKYEKINCFSANDDNSQAAEAILYTKQTMAVF
ncbi:MAG: hypothetical protein AB8E15_12645 [Bdellovibrionales bacterium]